MERISEVFSSISGHLPVLTDITTQWKTHWLDALINNREKIMTLLKEALSLEILDIFLLFRHPEEYPAFKCKLPSSEAHSALFFYMKITALWSCSRKDTHSARKTEGGQAHILCVQTITSRKLSPGMYDLSQRRDHCYWSKLYLKELRSEDYQVLKGYTHISIHAPCNTSLSIPWFSSNTIYWKLSELQ